MRLIQSYEDLKVYQKSYENCLKVYDLCKRMPKEELFGVSAQLKRASISIPLNIAEGYGKRESAKEFKRYLYMAKGSCNEMKVLVDFCRDLGYLAKSGHMELKGGYDEIGKMLNGLISKWE